MYYCRCRRVVYHLSVVNFIEVYTLINKRLQFLATCSDDGADTNPLFLLSGIRVDREQLKIIVTGPIIAHVIP
jgi:hypothetical protein